MSAVILQEEWRSVVGFEGFYEVSNLGRVRRLPGFLPTKRPGAFRSWKGRIMKLHAVKKDGHLLFRFCKYNVRGNYSVHRAVLEAFVGPCPEGMQACHFPDRDPTNNRLDNLRWDTPKANSLDSLKHGTRARGDRQGSAKLDAEKVKDIRENYRHHTRDFGAKAFAAKYSVSLCTIQSVVSGRYWSHIQ